MAVIYPETPTSFACLRMRELINQLNAFSQVAAHLPHHCVKVVLREVFGNPESNVFVAGWIFRIRSELVDLSCCELVDKTGILAPKQPYVVDFE